MDKSNPVNWFEIPVTDIARATAFYQHVLGVELRQNEMGPMKMAWFPWDQTATGATGSLVLGAGYVPSLSGSVVYFAVPDIEAVLTRLVQKGGKVLSPKVSIGEYGYVAHFQDCEGNRVALHSVK